MTGTCIFFLRLSLSFSTYDLTELTNLFSRRLDPKSRYLLDIIRDHLTCRFCDSESVVKHLRSSSCTRPPRKLRSTKLFELSFLRTILQRLNSLFLRLSPSSGPILVISSHSVPDNVVLSTKHRKYLADLRILVNGAIDFITMEKSVVERRISGSSTGSHNEEETKVYDEMEVQNTSSDECDGGFTSTASTLREDDLFCNEEMEMDLDELF